MSNIVPSNINVPAHIAARMGKSVLADNIAGGLQTGGVPRISLKGSRFRIVEDGIETVLDSMTIDVVIVGANPGISKTWYAKQWNKDDEPTAPDCYSLNGKSPDPASADPQNDLCATCPHNAWGSKVTPNGQQVKACADTKRLAVLSADDVEDSKVYLLTVTPAVLKDLAQYQKQLSMRGFPPEMIRTRLGFDTDASFPKLTFKFGGFLDEAQIEAVEKRLGSEEVIDVTGEREPVAAPAAKQIAKPASIKPKAVAKKAPEPVEEEVEEVEAEEVEDPKPAAKKGFGGGSIASKVAAVEAEATAPAKKGFGAAKAAPAAAAPVKKTAPKPAPAAKEAADDDALANEIADLMAGLADDESE
jgi:hypothetical protein